MNFGMISNSLSGGGNSGFRFFYIVSVRNGLFTPKWIITETTGQGFRDSQ